ncbi:S-protein homolog 5, partial [Rosa chinensis]|uniref:S-protein homolog 5 n=1 Tax=Rosa chinensis TaxID=74649 RepID=UPI000D089752
QNFQNFYLSIFFLHQSSLHFFKLSSNNGKFGKLVTVSPLIVHCKSKNDDLGDHTLWINQEFRWYFGLNFWFTTLFYCNFKWDSQEKHIDVFNTPDESPLECMENEECFWKVTEDGFFVSVDNINWVKKLNWHD